MRKLPHIQDCSQIGKVSRPNGKDGELLISLFTGMRFDFTQIEFLFFEINNKLVPFKILKYTYRKNSLLANLISIDTEAMAERYERFKVYLQNEFIVNTEDENKHELFAFEVFNNDELIGTVKDVIEYPMHSVLEIDSEIKRELLVPLNDDFIVSIDNENKQLFLDLPDGILDL